MEPVCVECGVEMHCEKTGVFYVARILTTEDEYAYIFMVDKWRCKNCSKETLVGFAHEPYNHSPTDTDIQILKDRGEEVIVQAKRS